MKIEKMLFVTRFEKLGFDALKSLLPLRKAGLDHVVFLTVIEREKVAMRRGTGYQRGEAVKLKEMANIRFIDWAENLFEEGMEVGVYIVVGHLVPQVVSAAEKESVDLIVIGQRHKSRLDKFYSGSEVTEIIRRAPIPVLVYKLAQDEALRNAAPFERPLLVVDWTSAGESAIEYLLGLSGVCKEIHVMHVADPKSLSKKSAMTVQKTRKEIRAKLDEVCEKFEASGIVAKPHVHVGEPLKEIELSARDNQASLVVLGTSPQWVIKERWLGSLPQTVCEKSSFPTLLVPSNK